MNDAAVGPPGVMPIQQPTSALRSSVTQCRGSVSAVRNTSRGLMRAWMPSKRRPSSMVCSNSPRPKSPMTATRKLMPLTRSGMPNVRRTLPDIVSTPMVATAKPSVIETTVLNGEVLPMPTKLAKTSR